MADGDFALPIGHVSAATQSAPTIRMAIGRPFRQPIALPDATAWSSGLEIWLHSDLPDRKIYAMFDGYLRFVPADTSNLPNELHLDLSVGTKQRYRNMRGALEPHASTVIYQNIDRDSIEITLRQLILDAYNSGSKASSCPVLGNMWKNKRLKYHLQEPGVIPETEIREFVRYFLDNPGSTMRIGAGDPICDAGIPLPGEQIPPNLPFSATVRRITIFTIDYADNALNPTYYIWRYLLDAYATPDPLRMVTFITRAPRQVSGKFDHPLLSALNIDLGVKVLPRIITQVQLPNIATPYDALLFPIGKLGDWHGEKWAGAVSTIQWKINNDANLEFQTRHTPGVSDPQQDCPINVTNPATIPYHNSMHAFWNQWGSQIDEFCKELQIPSEIILATVGQESDNPRALALEPLYQRHIRRLQNANPPVAQSLIQAYIDLTPRYGLTVDDPWNGAGVIDAAKSPLTWDDLLIIIDVVPERMSPGLIQTLVKTGEDLYNWLSEWYTNIPGLFQVANPLASPPVRYRDWFFWLLTPRHSLLAGTAYHKRSYAQLLGGLDLPRMGSLYNSLIKKFEMPLPDQSTFVYPMINDSEKLSDPGRQVPPCPALPPNQDPRNPWRLCYYDLTYPRNLGRYYNAIQAYFGNGANAATLNGQPPTVRFWRNL